MSLSTDASRGGKAKWESTYGLMLPTYPPCSQQTLADRGDLDFEP